MSPGLFELYDHQIPPNGGFVIDTKMIRISLDCKAGSQLTMRWKKKGGDVFDGQ
jgi:hypothetical protein